MKIQSACSLGLSRSVLSRSGNGACRDTSFVVPIRRLFVTDGTPGSPQRSNSGRDCCRPPKQALIVSAKRQPEAGVSTAQPERFLEHARGALQEAVDLLGIVEVVPPEDALALVAFACTRRITIQPFACNAIAVARETRRGSCASSRTTR